MILKRRIKTLISIIKLNLIIIIFKLSNPNSKIIFFYHPRKLLTFIHTDYIKDLFNQFEGKYLTLYGHGVDQLFEKNHFFILQGYLKWIFNVDLFMSNNVCEVFTKNSTKIYMHHDIFDTPLTNVQKEKEFSNRLIKYDYIFLSSEVSLKQFSNLFEKNEKNQPIMKVVGYAKLDFIIKNFKSNLSKKNQLIIAPTNFYAYPELEITRHLKRIIDRLLKNTNFNIVYRPHPSNRNDPKILEIKSFFKKNSKFYYDASDNYFITYSESMFLITDLSGTAYTYAFLTYNPVLFISINEKYLKQTNYTNLNYFRDREKIGLILENENNIEDKLKQLSHGKQNFKKSILEIRNKISYLGSSKKRIRDIIETILM